MNDNVNHPNHYTSHPSGVECIELTEDMNFCLGNAFKYVWRHSLKNGREDLEKAIWYLNRNQDRGWGITAKTERLISKVIEHEPDPQISSVFSYIVYGPSTAAIKVLSSRLEESNDKA